MSCPNFDLCWITFVSLVCGGMIVSLSDSSTSWRPLGVSRACPMPSPCSSTASLARSSSPPSTETPRSRGWTCWPAGTCERRAPQRRLPSSRWSPTSSAWVPWTTSLFSPFSLLDIIPNFEVWFGSVQGTTSCCCCSCYIHDFFVVVLFMVDFLIGPG